METLIDTNVLLDVLIKREPYFADSARVWALSREKIIKGCLSAICINNLYWIIRKLNDQKIAGAFVDQVLEDFEIIALTKNILKQARTVAKRDFEDLIQYFSAVHEGCEVLVTRNKKDFPAIGIKIMSPRELLHRIEKGGAT